MNTSAKSIRLRSYPSPVRLALAVYVLALGLGTCVHAAILFHLSGPPPHRVSQSLMYGFDTLAFFDPLTVVLLFIAPRAGLLLAMTITLADVGGHTIAAHMYSHPPVGWYLADSGAQANSIFLGFVLGSAPFLWPYLGRKDVL